jgi:hypothetical protein
MLPVGPMLWLLQPGMGGLVNEYAMKVPERTRNGQLSYYLSNRRSEVGLSIVLFLILLIIYESMAPTRLSSANFGSDGGDYLSAVLTHGIPHPTGYPFYLILSDLFQNLFTNSVVWRQVQVSIFPGIFAALLLLPIVIVENKSLKRSEWIVPSAMSVLSLALAPLFWSQSIIIEVYALNAFFTSLGILWFFLVTKLNSDQLKNHQILLCLIAWICGLGLGNHRTILFLYPLTIIALVVLYRSKLNKVIFFLCTIGWLSGLLTYLILPIRASLHPPINWGNPDTLKGFLWLITGGDYGNNIFAIRLIEYPARIFSWVGFLFKQFGFFGVMAGVFGITSAFIQSKTFRIATVYIFLIYSIFSIGYKTNDSMVYLLPVLIVFSIWIGLGIGILWLQKWKNINLGLILSILIFLNICIVFPIRYQEVNPQNGDLANYAEQTLAQAPQQAAIYPEDDGRTFSLWFYQYGKNLRPDVKIISRGLLRYPWYRDELKQLYPDIKASEMQ